MLRNECVVIEWLSYSTRYIGGVFITPNGLKSC
jgi:hypothetical protein